MNHSPHRAWKCHVCQRRPAADGGHAPHCVAAAGEASTVTVATGPHRVLLLQKLDDLLRITSGRRVADTIQIGGTVLIPRQALSDVLKAVRALARTR
ncbi:MAG: hypothetical protein ACREMF_11935 [Gemmatimonadales bacterium]